MENDNIDPIEMAEKILEAMGEVGIAFGILRQKVKEMERIRGEAINSMARDGVEIDPETMSRIREATRERRKCRDKMMLLEELAKFTEQSPILRKTIAEMRRLESKERVYRVKALNKSLGDYIKK